MTVEFLNAMIPRCPHGRGVASACSSCLGAPARHVEVRDGVVIIDDAPTRASEPVALSARQQRSSRRGGARVAARRRAAATARKRTA